MLYFIEIVTASHPGLSPILGLDIGSVYTRAMLFEPVENCFLLAGSGCAPTTASAPFFNLRAGLRAALEELQAITGRVLLDVDKTLIRPLRKDGSGVAECGAVFSAGLRPRVVWVALDGDNNPGSLLAALGADEIQITGVNDRRKPQAILDAILRLRPDLILTTSKAETQPTQACLAALEPVRMAYYLLPAEQRPALVFTCALAWQSRLRSIFGPAAEFVFLPAQSTTPTHAAQSSTQRLLSDVVIQVHQRQIKGLAHVGDWARGNLLTAQAGFGNTIRLLSQQGASLKPVLGIDLGAGALKVAAAYQGELIVGAYHTQAAGGSWKGLIGNGEAASLRSWIAVPKITDAMIQEYLANRPLYPASLPVTVEELAMEEALTRGQMRSTLDRFTPILPGDWPAATDASSGGFEPILAAGGAISGAPGLAHACLTLLDGLQPQGITTLISDRCNLAAALGTLVDSRPEMVLQIMQSGSFTHLCTVISPVGNAPPGTPVLQVEIAHPDQPAVKLTIKQGALETLPLPVGQTARLTLQPFHRYDVGLGGPGRGGELRVTGSALGVVIDCRGRPLHLHDDLQRRGELFRKWVWTMGG